MEEKVREAETVISKMNRKTFLKNIGIVFASNIISTLSGIMIGFIIPKILGISEYGYYKTFTLYSSYIGILHFGFIDGIYLKFAGKNYYDLDKEKFRTFFRFLLFLEIITTLIIFSISFFFFKTNYFWIIVFVAINILATNLTTYYEFLSQITMMFKRTSIRNVIRCFLNIISVSILYLLYRFNGMQIYNYHYVVITLAINYLITLWYIITYRELTFGKAKKIKEVKDDIITFFKSGVILLLSNFVVQLIFVIDQQVVNLAFDNSVYSVYAFAYSMIHLLAIATTAISTVLYPTLKRMDEKILKEKYSQINAYLLIFMGFSLIAFYPLKIIIENFLPKYSEALPIFLIILPGILISSSISVIKYNCYKTFNKITNYFIKSLITLAIAISADILAFYIFGNTISISIVSIFTLIIWYLLAESYFIKTFKISWVRNFLYLISTIIGFYCVSLIPNIFISLISYLGFYLLLTFLFYTSEIKTAVETLKNRKRISNAEDNIL